MHVFISRPFDDPNIFDVYFVEHKDGANAKAFEKDWDKAVAKAKRNRPETWMVDEAIKDLERQRWQILRVDHSIVTY